MVVDAEGAKDGLLVSMKEKMAELERINKDLVVQCRTLRERYEKNDLTDEEKDFVDWLQRVCQSLHEQEDVAKENELRRVPCSPSF
ncbi:hypothetical protein L208DRAFT_1397677 [Tricholoma matsutake]|nr:hypothetical protein L208DRAFT_1397677 [Tricholoma matsutake 945]